MRQENRRTLLEHEAADLCKVYGIPVVEAALAKSVEEAVKHAERIGFPVVLKIVSRDILHKSDVGGVILDIASSEEVKRAYNDVIARVRERRPTARIDGVLVAKRARQGKEFIIGMTRDKTFGPVVVFGLGGVFTELLRDISLRVAPIGRREAFEMMSEIKGAKVLHGYRGEGPVDKEALADIIAAVGRMGYENPEIESVDLNPVAAYESGALVMDAKIILSS
ncbi:MAG: acetate--CoA ligase family protein [Candidatus Caldarchaeum sp.]